MNMKGTLAFVLSIIFLPLVLLPACNNSVDDMVKQYNGGFNVGYVQVSKTDNSDYPLEPDDSGYDQKRLLFDDYTVFDIGTLNLAAPDSCTAFSWTLTDPDAANTSEPVPIIFYDGEKSSVRRTRDFIVYIPESGLETEHTYKLTLAVTGKSGGIYTDSCLVYIVKYYVTY